MNRDYIELQREFGSLCALRDGFRVGTNRYHGPGEFIDPAIRQHLEKAEQHIREAIALVEEQLEKMEAAQ
jgi:hypothetical protein